jgi:Bacterial regulatory helix-turn-helix protein, lysR family
MRPPCCDRGTERTTEKSQLVKTVSPPDNLINRRRPRLPSPCGAVQLEAFVAVATQLHSGRAASRLNETAPTLGEMIRRLERELAAPLLTCTTRQVALTSAAPNCSATRRPFSTR